MYLTVSIELGGNSESANPTIDLWFNPALSGWDGPDCRARWNVGHYTAVID